MRDTMYVPNEVHEAIWQLDQKFPFSTRQKFVYNVVDWLHEPVTFTPERKKINLTNLRSYLNYLYEYDGYDKLVEWFYVYNEGKDYGSQYDILSYLIFMVTDYFYQKDYDFENDSDEMVIFFTKIQEITRLKQNHDEKEDKLKRA